MKFNEKTIDSSIAYKRDFLQWNILKVELPNNTIAYRDIIKHPGAAAILPILEDNKILLIKQFRKAIEKDLIEIPAGKLELNENPLDCAKRELEEETGFKANKIEYLGKIATTPGFCDEIIYLFKATELTLGNKNLDEDEFTSNIIMSLDELKIKVKNGEIIDSKTIAMLAYL